MNDKYQIVFRDEARQLTITELERETLEDAMFHFAKMQENSGEKLHCVKVDSETGGILNVEFSSLSFVGKRRVLIDDVEFGGTYMFPFWEHDIFPNGSSIHVVLRDLKRNGVVESQFAGSTYNDAAEYMSAEFDASNEMPFIVAVNEHGIIVKVLFPDADDAKEYAEAYDEAHELITVGESLDMEGSAHF